MKHKLLLLSLLFSALLSYGQDTFFKTKEGAIKGYDVVAYFTEGMPKKGLKEHRLEWGGVTWQFSSASNLELFKNNPEKYLPQYNGYCAYGVAKGEKYPIDPNAWAIVDGKLYLNYDAGVQKTWKEDQQNMIKEADENWKKIK